MDNFTEQLKTDFPKIFAESRVGIYVDKGWHDIIYQLCEKIQYHVDQLQEFKEKHGEGDGCEQVVVLQIKEKFGGLRFYYNGGDAYVDGLVSMAESWAGRTCEICGERGKSRPSSWVRTLCDRHWQEENLSSLQDLG